MLWTGWHRFKVQFTINKMIMIYMTQYLNKLSVLWAGTWMCAFLV